MTKATAHPGGCYEEIVHKSSHSIAHFSNHCGQIQGAFVKVSGKGTNTLIYNDAHQTSW